MEAWKKPIWRVPLVLGALGVLNRLLHFAGSLLWGLIQRGRGPGPDGTIVLTTGYVTEIVSVITFLLFWWAGWRFVRDLTRREIFRSASIMVLLNAALLAAEQISQHVFGTYSWAVYHLYTLAEGKMWLDQLSLRLFQALGLSSGLWVVPGIFAPYLYLIFGKKNAPQRGVDKEVDQTKAVEP